MNNPAMCNQQIKYGGLLLLALVLLPCFAFSQNESGKKLILTLDQVIERAREHSPDALVAKNLLLNKYWQYRTFSADYLPMLSMEATTPDLSQTISPIVQDDGSQQFVRSSTMNSSLKLNIDQNIGLTGGSIFMTSSLQRLDLLNLDSNNFSYLSSPISIGFRQPVMSFNAFRWNKKIEPMRYEEAKRQYLEDMEQVAITATNRFFDLMIAQISLEIATKNKANNDTLYKISRGRYNLGKIAENELLQMELAYLNSQTSLAQSRLDVETKMFDLRTYLGYTENVRIELIAPLQIPKIETDVTTALSQARQNRKKVIEMDRQLVEAQRDVARAKGDVGFNANFFGTFGLTKNATGTLGTDADGDLINAVYQNPEQASSARLGISIPILDWGKGRAQVKMAQANEELVRTQVEQASLSFEQEIYLKIMQFDILQSQLKIANKSDTIAQKRFHVAKQRYLIGKIDITELNIAIEEKDVAKRSYYEKLRQFWTEVYNIRKLTLYDFQKGQKIPFEEKF